MLKKLTNLSLATAFAAALVFGQTSTTTTNTPPTPADRVQHQVARLTALLSLTADQQTQATTIFTNAATAEAANHTAMKAAHDTLKTAIQNNDTATIDQTATALGNLTATTIATQAKADAAFYQILTADQKTKFVALGHEFGGGPGGAGFHRGH